MISGALTERLLCARVNNTAMHLMSTYGVHHSPGALFPLIAQDTDCVLSVHCNPATLWIWMALCVPLEQLL